jgi:hypothetical protein
MIQSMGGETNETNETNEYYCYPIGKGLRC